MMRTSIQLKTCDQKIIVSFIPLGTTTMKRLVLHLIRLYQLCLSSLLGPRCRFYPTCSHYTIEAIDQYGLWQGSKLGLTRICKCHPFHSGGYDPVPLNANNPALHQAPRID